MFVGFIYLELNKPKPINWYPSYVTSHKVPYGTYVFTESFPTLFKSEHSIYIDKAPYEYLQDSTVNGTYIFINNVINFGEEEFDLLKAFVARGNEVFISTHGVSIEDFSLKTEAISSLAFEQEPFFKLLNPRLPQERFTFDRNFYNSTFVEVDTAKTVGLGKTGFTNAAGEEVVDGINYIKYRHGKGTFFFHTFPEAFTNYFMLKDNNAAYVSAVVSYLNPNAPILIDGYYKEGKAGIQSEMYYILNTKAFKWGYYLAIAGVLIFIIFNGKRKQRVIPIIPAVKNQSIAFTRTVANMYYEKSANKAMAMHKITYFLNYIRATYHVSTATIDARFYEQLAARSEQNEEDIKQLFTLITTIENSAEVSKETLIELNNKIDTFKKTQAYGSHGRT